MNARDEARRVIHTAHCLEIVHNDDCMFWEDDATSADALLASGYRKPRTITTAEELDALPRDVLVLTEQGGYWESIKRHDGKNWWKEPGGQNVSPSEDLTLPATVVHEPEAMA